MNDLNDIPISQHGMEAESVRDIISEKDRVIDVAMRDVESLKREICDLKQQLNNSKKKK